MRYIFRCDFIVLLAQLVEHVEGSLMMYVRMYYSESFYVANHANWGIFTELSPFHVRMHCIPCCGP